MQAGRELDAMVAEKVMGWNIINKHMGSPPKETWDEDTVVCIAPIPHYSTDIAAAWKVVEKMQYFQKPSQMGHPLHLKYCWWVNKWWACVESSEALEETAPLAISKAALKAVGVDMDE